MLSDFHSTIIIGTCEVKLKFFFEKTVILNYVLHTSCMRKNLVGYILNKVRFTQKIGAYLYIITKNNFFVVKGYAINSMFKLNVEINKVSPSIDMLCFFNT